MEGRRINGQFGVIGGRKCLQDISDIAREVGREIAKRGFALVCGGLGGVMEAACQGAQEAGGVTIGILPTGDKRDANPYIDIVIPTDLGHARNVLVVNAADALVAIAGGGPLANGGAGTLSEIAIALKVGKPIVGIKTWTLEGSLPQAEGGQEAMDMLMAMLQR